MAEHDDVSARIVHAMSRRHLLRLNYHFYSRVVEPYAIGKVHDDRVVLVAWQVSGGSGSSRPVGWKTFALDDIIGVFELMDVFTPCRVPASNPFRGQPLAECRPEPG